MRDNLYLRNLLAFCMEPRDKNQSVRAISLYGSSYQDFPSLQATEDLVAQQAANGHARADVEKRKGVLSATEERYEEAKARMTAEGRQLGSLQQRMQVRTEPYQTGLPETLDWETGG